MTYTREIPRSSWAQTLSAISARKALEPVIVRVESLEEGDQPLAEGMPLAGLSLEAKGSEADAIELTLSQCGGKDNFTHLIQHPEHVYVQEDERGNLKSIDIEDGQQIKTIIFFDAASPATW